MSKKLKLSLFRSLLRWNRKPYVCQSPFTLTDSNYKFKQYLSHLPQYKDVTEIKNSEQFQYFLFELFRNGKGTDDAIDHAFTVLKDLTALSEKMKENHSLHINSMDPGILNYREYKVGEVVRHRTKGFRGIVCGWNLIAGTQNVYVLRDTTDNKYLPRDVNSQLSSQQPIAVVESHNLERITEPYLQYIHNSNVNQLFSSFDKSISRYVPRVDLSFRFYGDMDSFTQRSDQILDYPSSTGSHPSEQSLVSSLLSVLSTTLSKAKTMRSMIESYGIQLPSNSVRDPQASMSIVKLGGIPAFIGKLTLQETANAVIHDIMDYIEKIEELCNLGHVITQRENERRFTKSIRRGNSHLHPIKEHKKNYDGRALMKSKFDRMYINPTSSESLSLLPVPIGGVNQAGVRAKHIGLPDSGRISITELFEVVHKAVNIYSTCVEQIDVLLQLRFQSKGLTYFENLMPTARDLVQNMNLNSSVNIIEENDSRVPQSSLDKIDSVTAGPVKYSFGTIVKHENLDCRGIVVGWDKRPNFHSTEQNDAEGLDQPFYKVIADDEDIERAFGTGIGIPYHYIAEDKLKPVTKFESNDYLSQYATIHTPMKDIYLRGFDESAKYFYWPTKLSFCFPLECTPQQILSAKNFENIRLENARVMDESYIKIEKLLLELYALHKHSAYYSQIMSYENLPVSKLAYANSLPPIITSNAYVIKDVMAILSASPSSVISDNFETLMYQVSISHKNPMERKLIRQGVNYLKRSMLRESIECFEEIIKDYDPEFVEAHHKLAVSNYHLNNGAESVRYGEKTLNYFPSYHGGLVGSGLGMKLEGNMSSARIYFIKTIEAHPFVIYVSSILNGLIYDIYNKKKVKIGRKKNPAASIVFTDDKATPTK